MKKTILLLERGETVLACAVELEAHVRCRDLVTAPGDIPREVVMVPAYDRPEAVWLAPATPTEELPPVWQRLPSPLPHEPWPEAEQSAPIAAAYQALRENPLQTPWGQVCLLLGRMRSHLEKELLFTHGELSTEQARELTLLQLLDTVETTEP